jgi:predicted nucleotidyltransferase
MLIPAGRKKILEIFLNAPFTELHMREIARLSHVSLTNVDASLRLFVKEDLFKRRDISQMSFFKPNMGNERLLKIFEIMELERKTEFYKKNKQIARLLQEYTEKVTGMSRGKIQSVILFGSVARGEWTRKSDIDILAVVQEKEDDVTAILNKAKGDMSPLLTINPVSTAVSKFEEGVRKKTEFYEQLWKDRIVLYNEFMFWRMVREGGGTHG